MSVTFITYAQAAADVREWSRRLPEFDAVCGIPRSGTIIAAMLSQFRNCHLVEFADLMSGNRPWRQPARRQVGACQRDRVLVVDDTCWSGRTVAIAHEQLRYAKADIEFGALYYGEKGRNELDHAGRKLLTPIHEFEWNLGRTCLASKWLFDMDGVLCEDWGQADIGPNAELYDRHCRDVRPLYLPIVPVRGIVTARMEGIVKPQTEEWLRRHGVIYDRLVMFPGGDVLARERHGHARYKADVYAADPKATLFVESSLQQAREIADRTRRPVLSIEGMQLFNGIAAGDWAGGPLASQSAA